jgi:UDP-N-acetylmuramoylalanine--D-glutamate ligase
MGRSGEAAARFLCGQGARVSCSDRRTAEELGDAARRLTADGCTLRLGGQRPGDFLDADLIVVSPGVPMPLPPLQEALDAGIEVIGEMELAFRHVRLPVVSVTGSNGKTTTVSLNQHMLETAGVPHWTGGNIGRPLTEFLLGETPAPGKASPRVLLTEVSSFQLETISRFRPWIAVWTNLSPDHLDRYPDMEAYAEAKIRIFMNQTAEDFALVPRDDAWLNRHRDRIRASVLSFGTPAEPMPEIALENGAVCLRLHGEGSEERYPTERVRLVGRHNLENIMVALAVARMCGADPDPLQEAMESFEGLEHRMEHVEEIDGVRFYNDSKATTVVSVMCALESFDRPVLLLAGGKDKGGSYAPLRGPLGDHARMMILFGQASGRMREELEGVCEIRMAEDLEGAVEIAQASARRGEVVLLSPGCSSFDQFRDYEDRGGQYKELVRRIRRRGGTHAG